MKYDPQANNVKVTVGLCVKNSEATIQAALNSLFDQDFPHESIELIVVDGFSKDRTLKFLEDTLKKTDVRAKIFRENHGLGQARQMVVDNASGQYIVWVDGDMTLSKDFIAKQVNFMEQNPRAGIAKGKYGDCTKGTNRNIIAILENMEFILSTMSEGETNSKSLGTSGCIYRLKAVKEAQGFDRHIRGVGEDMDIENRIREAGWSIYITPAIFYETRRSTLKSLWNEYFWHGRGGHHLFRKNKQIINLYMAFPPVAFLREFFRMAKAYRLTRKKIVLFLPLHYTFKRMAWFLGFVSSRL